MAAPVLPVQHGVRTHRNAKKGASAAASSFPRGRRLLRLLPELAGLVLCAVLWLQAGQLSTSADGPGPAFYPRVLLALLALALVVRVVQEWRAVPTAETAEVTDDGLPALPVSRRRLGVAIALAVGYVAGSAILGWVVATFAFVVAFLFAAGARRLLVTVPVAVGLTVGLAYLFGKVVYLSLPVGRGVFAELTLRFFEVLGVY